MKLAVSLSHWLLSRVPLSLEAREDSRSYRSPLANLVLVLCVCSAAPSMLAKSPEVKAFRGRIDIPTYPWQTAVKHPYFRGSDGVNIYPYPMMDNLSRTREPRTWQTVVLENDCLRVTFLPELGGRIYEVFDKTAGQQVFYVNHVVKPGLIGQCGAWISGGIEFNTGPAGHTVSAVLPVDVRILPAASDGSRSVAVGERERIYGTQWTVVVTLRPGRSFLEETIRIYNQTETVRPYYFWNCTAVANPLGFRFIYPMTLGTDHAGTTFYTWPISDGKDLSRGTNYQDASSVFAYQCDQDFFGSYDDGTDRGVVSYANHHQVPGKKAWTWGHGSYGTMHQMDLTDADGPYNEVQTGPLFTQADVGRLEPLEAVAWQEWWYPVRGIGGFTFANRDLAANATLGGGGLRLRMIGSGTWNPVLVRVSRGGIQVAGARCALSPRQPVDLAIGLDEANPPVEVELTTAGRLLARFRVPLDLPVRTPPAKPSAPQSPRELEQAGWQDYLFARETEAESRFRKTLEKDPQSATAHAGLAYLNLDRDPSVAVAEAKAALAVDPDLGPARYVLAVAESRSENLTAALDDAWQAALDPKTAVGARALVAKLLIRQGNLVSARAALAEPGPWTADPVCRNRLAFALFKTGDKAAALQLARTNLALNPLDTMAMSVLWLADDEATPHALADLIGLNPDAVIDLAAEYLELGQEQVALKVAETFYCSGSTQQKTNPIPYYWAAYLSNRSNTRDAWTRHLKTARSQSVEGVFPHQIQSEAVLRWAVAQDPQDGKAALYLGHLLFSLGRHAEGRALWERAAALNVAPAIAFRALGMAAQHLDKDPQKAADFLGRANKADPADAIVARDLARVLLSLADKEGAGEKQREHLAQVRTILEGALAQGRGRSDFVALLARAHTRLGEHAETAKLLDSVRITIWEGAHEAHDLFEEAHLALGKAHLDAGRASEALAEFNRALEYPANLATGKLENAREAHIHYLRGNAFAALGQKQAAAEAWRKAATEPSSGDARKEEARRQAQAALDRAP